MRIVVIVATWLAMMVWIGPPQHLRPFVHRVESVYALWQRATEEARYETVSIDCAGRHRMVSVKC